MHGIRIAFVVSAALCLVLLAPALADQKKAKDEFMYHYLVDHFTQVTAKQGKLDERITSLDGRFAALDGELGQLKQQQKDLNTDMRDAQNLLKSVDTSLNSLRLGSQQDLFSLKADVAQLRTEFAALSDLIKKSPALTAKPAEAPASVAPTPALTALEGYITAVQDNEVTINVGSGAGVKVGAVFNVFKAGDPANEVGVIEVAQVIDTNNSQAKVVYRKADTKLEFSDIVRLK